MKQLTSFHLVIQLRMFKINSWCHLSNSILNSSNNKKLPSLKLNKHLKNLKIKGLNKWKITHSNKCHLHLWTTIPNLNHQSSVGYRNNHPIASLNKFNNNKWEILKCKISLEQLMFKLLMINHLVSNLKHSHKMQEVLKRRI